MKNKLNRKIIALTLVLTLLLSFAGCKTESSSSSTQVSTDSSQNQSSVSTDSKDDTSGNESVGMTSSKIDTLSGEISVDYTTENTKKTTDEGDIVPVINGAGLAYDYVGYAEKEANALRNEILNTPNTEEFYEIKGTKYYISPNGDDANSGKSPKEAWQTLDASRNVVLKAGDAILFERDSLYRFYVGYGVTDGVIYGSYGKGRKPMIYGSAMNFALAQWTPTNRKNIWKTSYTYEKTCNIVFNQGEMFGNLKSEVRTLEENGDFYLDENMSILYIYSEKGNPSNVWESIECGKRSNAFSLGTRHNDIIFDNLAFRYFSGGPIHGTYDCNNITVTNCEIGFSGGGYIQGSTTRAGNGITTWQGGKNYVWDHNWVYQTFDSAISPQGNGGKVFPFVNITMSNNLLEYNNCDIEIFDGGGGESGEYTGVWKNLKMDNNIMRFTSLGWGTRADGGKGRGIDGVIRGFFATDKNGVHVTAEIDNISFSNNIIDCPGKWIMNFSQDEHHTSEWKMTGNKYYFKGSYRLSNGISQGYWKGWSGGGYNKKATNQSTLETAIKWFDPNAEVIKWYD